MANTHRLEEMVLPIIGPGDRLLDYDDGLWDQRLLPVYDHAQNLLHPKHYASLKGALVNVTALAISKTDHDKKSKGCYLQVRKMEVLIPGRRT